MKIAFIENSKESKPQANLVQHDLRQSYYWFSFSLIELHILLTCCPVGKHCYLWETLSSPVQFWIHWRPPSNEFHMLQMNRIPRKWFNVSGNGAIKPDFPAWPDGFTVTSCYFSLSSQSWRTALTISTWSNHMCFKKKAGTRPFYTPFTDFNTPTSPKVRLLSIFLIVCAFSSNKKKKKKKEIPLERQPGMTCLSHHCWNILRIFF